MDFCVAFAMMGQTIVEYFQKGRIERKQVKKLLKVIEYDRNKKY